MRFQPCFIVAIAISVTTSLTTIQCVDGNRIRGASSPVSATTKGNPNKNLRKLLHVNQGYANPSSSSSSSSSSSTSSSSAVVVPQSMNNNAIYGCPDLTYGIPSGRECLTNSDCGVNHWVCVGRESDCCCIDAMFGLKFCGVPSDCHNSDSLSCLIDKPVDIVDDDNREDFVAYSVTKGTPITTTSTNIQNDGPQSEKEKEVESSSSSSQQAEYTVVEPTSSASNSNSNRNRNDNNYEKTGTISYGFEIANTDLDSTIDSAAAVDTTTPQKKSSSSTGSDLCSEEDQLYVMLQLDTGDKFYKKGKITLEDISSGDDTNNDNSKNSKDDDEDYIWEEDDFDKNSLHDGSECLDIDGCYEFTVIDENGDGFKKGGYLKLWVDTGDNDDSSDDDDLEKVLEMDDKFDVETVQFGEGC